MRYRLQRHDGTDCSATMVPFTVLRMVPIQRYRQCSFFKLEIFSIIIAINKQINTSIVEMQIYWQRSFYILSIVCKA